MNHYRIRGIHSENRAKAIEEKFNRAINTDSIRIDYPHRTLSFPSGLDINKLNRIAAFEKIIIEAEDNSDQEDSHSHQHESGHSHSHHQDVDFSSSDKAAKNMKIVFIINLFFSILEFFFGVLFNSAAILTDAVHDLGDAISIGLAWFFQKISTRQADAKYSFGHQRFSLLGALVTGGILLTGSLFLIANTIPILFDPQSVNYQGMFWLAIFAIVANGYSAWLMNRGSSANESMLNLHLLEDVLGWIGVLIVSIVVKYTEWYILDPILSLIIAAFIIWQAWPLFKETAQIFLEVVPSEIDIEAIREEILNISGVHSLAHLHIWSIDGEEHAMSVTISTDNFSNDEREKLKEKIRSLVIPLNVTHTTIETIADPDNIL